MRIPATLTSAVPRTTPMITGVLCDDDDGFDEGKELAGEVERGRDDAGMVDPRGDELLPGKEEEVVMGFKERVSEEEE